MDNLDHQQVCAALAALGHEARLTVFRKLVRSGDDGLRVGELVDTLNIPASTLSHHLRSLVHAGLVIQEKRGRETLNRPNFDLMRGAVAYLNSECCYDTVAIRTAC